MSLLKCPKCGEMFSDSYKTCPFCEEDEAFANGGKKPVNPGRRVHRQKSPSILGPTLVLVLVLVAGVLIYTLIGSGKPGDDQPDPPKNPTEDVDPNTPTVTLSLDQTALELTAGGTGKLAATGAEGITWTSSNAGVATVAEDGTVTAVAAGTATISASAEGADPRWSRDSSRSRKRPSGGRGDGSCGLGGGPPGGGLPGDESPPGGGGGSDGGGGGGRPETGPGAGSCWGMRLYAPCSLRMYRLYTLSLPFRQEFFPQMDEPCQMCRPLHLTLLFWFQKRPQGVQQLHGGAIAAAVFLCQRQKLPQQRRVQPAQSAKACRPSARLILRIGGRRR